MCLATGLWSASSICSVIGSSMSLLSGYPMCPYLFLYREACQFSKAEERFLVLGGVGNLGIGGLIGREPIGKEAQAISKLLGARLLLPSPTHCPHLLPLNEFPFPLDVCKADELEGNDQEPIQLNSISFPRHQTGKEHKQSKESQLSPRLS